MLSSVGVNGIGNLNYGLFPLPCPVVGRFCYAVPLFIAPECPYSPLNRMENVPVQDFNVAPHYPITFYGNHKRPDFTFSFTLFFYFQIKLNAVKSVLISLSFGFISTDTRQFYPDYLLCGAQPRFSFVPKTTGPPESLRVTWPSSPPNEFLSTPDPQVVKWVIMCWTVGGFSVQNRTFEPSDLKSSVRHRLFCRNSLQCFFPRLK
jgi:hypothetical protein